MTIDHEGVPRPGRSADGDRRAATELLDRPARPAQSRSAPPLGRHRRGIRSRSVLPAGLLVVDAVAGCAAAAACAVDPAHPLACAAAVLPVLLPLNLAGGLYRIRMTPSALDELPSLAARATVALACAVTLAGVLVGHWPSCGPLTPLRLLLLLTVLSLTAALGRAVLYGAARKVRRRRPVPVLVLGAGPLGQRVAAVLRERREYGMRPVGYLDPDPVLLPGDSPLPVLGGREVLEREIRRHGIRHLIATAGAADEEETTAALREATRLGCQVWLVPALREYGSLEPSVRRCADHLWGFPCLRLGRPAMRRPSWAVKRGVDILAACLGLLAVSPLLALCAAAVRWDTGPGVLFRQQRTGLDGRVFTLLKFRTLRPSNEHESATRWNISQDHRMGPVGRLLRRSSLDELPQLWNVLRGDMSLIGPRPERPYFVMRFGQAHPEYADRHRVPVGITGLAQVNGLRGDTSIEDRIRFDNRYIESWSLWQDVKILLRTAALMLHPDGS
ncbi:exopolysaccharide biosynthesis polyprenyl glycosylphosphotransferase [Kitasatospora sp. MAP12-15]|uniref:sugar transferase n=1 Tax=unclassified Kitasatospora TaxID=2633591 RepID=UPI0024730B08|nr:sugar transferase [Kitasatospora sp. MAP12-44]MDH6113472.1 exopolysaccharide biosynthesis polyprenyl glycosylphosphotransferase [Kitasatospora sp. MAP12-44]